MAAENREGLGMKVIAIMVQRYGVLPKELWDLNSISDMGAERGVTYTQTLTEPMLERIMSNSRYNIVNLTLYRNNYKVSLPVSIRRLSIRAQKYQYPLEPLPESLQELSFCYDCNHDKPLVLPNNLRKLVLGRQYNRRLVLPPYLVELKLGYEYQQPLVLPLRLQRMDFGDSRFNLPIALPPSLTCIYFNNAYNQPTILPSGIEELRVGSAFAHDLSFPPGLRKIEWCCDRLIQIPQGVWEIEFGSAFDQPVAFLFFLKKVTFAGQKYSHPVSFPAGLGELKWHVTEFAGLVLPESLQKLTWASDQTVRLPLGLRELKLTRDAPLVLPDGLLKVTFACASQRHYDLPESVQEVCWVTYSDEKRFTHPSALQHLIISFSSKEVDLSEHRIHKLAIGYRGCRIKQWPQGLKELVFTVDIIDHPLRVPKGCSIVGWKRPANVISE